MASSRGETPHFVNYPQGGFMRLIVLFFVCLLTIGTVGAREVDRSLSANPDAVQKQIDSMGLTEMPESTAKEMRGEYYWLISGAIWGSRALYSCAMTGICWGTLTMQGAKWYLNRYPKGNYTGGGGSW